MKTSVSEKVENFIKEQELKHCDLKSNKSLNDYVETFKPTDKKIVKLLEEKYSDDEIIQKLKDGGTGNQSKAHLSRVRNKIERFVTGIPKIKKAKKLVLEFFNPKKAKTPKEKKVQRKNSEISYAAELSREKWKHSRNPHLDAMLESRIFTGLFLTLGSWEFQMETSINSFKRFVYEFISCEGDEATYYKAVNTLKTECINNVTLYHGYLINKINSLYNAGMKVAHASLDFCDSLVNTRETIERFLDVDILKVGGTASITISNRAKNSGLAELQKLIAQFSNYEIIHYKKSQKGAYTDGKGPMVSVVIKRIK